jgi:hypothetical protein
LQKIIKRTRKTRKQNILIIYKKTLNITPLYTLKQISKSERNKRNQQERNKNQGKQKILQNRNRRNPRKNKISILIQVIIIDILL